MERRTSEKCSRFRFGHDKTKTKNGRRQNVGRIRSHIQVINNNNKTWRSCGIVITYDLFFRKKTTSELIRISAAVMGIEFSYAAETAFVSPILLKIGVQHEHMTMVWALSPILGFLITPILGSLSDGCRLSMGRRRPFILLLALGVLMGEFVISRFKIDIY